MIKTEEFSLFNGKVKLKQPQKGYRVAIDPILLAASVPKNLFLDKKILDMGCGIGTVGFCILTRFKANITAIDIQEDLIEIAKENKLLTNSNINFICGNIINYRVDSNGLYDAVIMNPPYMQIGNLPQNKIKKIANFETNDIGLTEWGVAAYKNLKSAGYLFLIHRSDRLDEILCKLKKANFGSFKIFPIWIREGEYSKRVIIVARKNKKSPLQLLAGLNLHTDSGYSKIANEIITNGKELRGLL